MTEQIHPDAKLRDRIRREALAYAVQAAERAHAASTVADHVSREDAIVAVLDEATAYWQVWSRGGRGGERDWREVADGLRVMVDEQARSIIYTLAPADVRRGDLAAVIADMRGPGDDN